jgi:acetamidase/formamidase
MSEHYLTATCQTTHWGWFEAGMQPVLTVRSGDTVTIETLSGGPDNLPGAGFDVPRALLDIHERSARQLPGHLLTGPVEVAGAEPGDVLEVRVLEVEPILDWGYMLYRPLGGALPGEFHEAAQIHAHIDLSSGTARFPWGSTLKLQPFLGVMGVAPPRQWGRISSLQPRAHGGNIDNKELGAGATLFLPVHEHGALFSCGDGHGLQGDGEVCLTALETALRARLEFHLHKDAGSGLCGDFPRAETATHLITMGLNEDLDTAARDALRRMIDWVSGIADVSRGDAYMLLSLVGELRITQVVNGEKGCHMMINKSEVAQLPRIQPKI